MLRKFALVSLLLAGCTQTVHFKVMETRGGATIGPLQGVRISHGDYVNANPSGEVVAIMVQWVEWDFQVTKADGTAAFHRTRPGGYYQFNKPDYSPERWDPVSAKYPDTPSHRGVGSAYLIEMWRYPAHPPSSTP